VSTIVSIASCPSNAGPAPVAARDRIWYKVAASETQQVGCQERGMDAEILLGCFIGGAALGVITVLVLWSRHRIERIAKRGPASARELLKGFRRE